MFGHGGFKELVVDGGEGGGGGAWVDMLGAVWGSAFVAEWCEWQGEVVCPRL
jgi:hypothetical protein